LLSPQLAKAATSYKAVSIHVHEDFQQGSLVKLDNDNIFTLQPYQLCDYIANLYNIRWGGSGQHQHQLRLKQSLHPLLLIPFPIPTLQLRLPILHLQLASLLPNHKMNLPTENYSPFFEKSKPMSPQAAQNTIAYPNNLHLQAVLPKAVHQFPNSFSQEP
jgi:hypothetical protein